MINSVRTRDLFSLSHTQVRALALNSSLPYTYRLFLSVRFSHTLPLTHSFAYIYLSLSIVSTSYHFLPALLPSGSKCADAQESPADPNRYWRKCGSSVLKGIANFAGDASDLIRNSISAKGLVIYGNWCGPGYSGGKSGREGAIDGLDRWFTSTIIFFFLFVFDMIFTYTYACYIYIYIYICMYIYNAHCFDVSLGNFFSFSSFFLLFSSRQLIFFSSTISLGVARSMIIAITARTITSIAAVTRQYIWLYIIF